MSSSCMHLWLIVCLCFIFFFCLAVLYMSLLLDRLHCVVSEEAGPPLTSIATRLVMVTVWWWWQYPHRVLSAGYTYIEVNCRYALFKVLAGKQTQVSALKRVLQLHRCFPGLCFNCSYCGCLRVSRLAKLRERWGSGCLWDAGVNTVKWPVPYG